MCAAHTAFNIIVWIGEIAGDGMHLTFYVWAKKLVHNYTTSNVIKPWTVLPLDHVPGTGPVDVMFAARV